MTQDDFQENKRRELKAKLAKLKILELLQKARIKNKDTEKVEPVEDLKQTGKEKQ